MGIITPSVGLCNKVEKAKATPSEAPYNKNKSETLGPYFKPSLLLIKSETDYLANE